MTTEAGKPPSPEQSTASAPLVIQLRDAVPTYFQNMDFAKLQQAGVVVDGLRTQLLPFDSVGEVTYAAGAEEAKDLLIVPRVGKAQMTVVNHHLYTFAVGRDGKVALMSDTPSWMRLGAVEGEVETAGVPFVDAYIIHQGGLVTLSDHAAAHVHILGEGGELRMQENSIATIDTVLPNAVIRMGEKSRLYLPNHGLIRGLRVEFDTDSDGALIYFDERYRVQGKIPPHIVHLMSDEFDTEYPLMRGRTGFDTRMNKHVAMLAYAPGGGFELFAAGTLEEAEEMQSRSERVMDAFGSMVTYAKVATELAAQQEAAQLKDAKPQDLPWRKRFSRLPTM